MPDNILLSACARVVLLLGVLALSSLAQAWDATGHRLTVYVAYESLTPAQRSHWLEVLRQHPRYDDDFLGEMPGHIRTASNNEQARWLLGQAAVWPDLARGLPDAIRSRYNRPDWHWINGAWVRDEAETQGNLYIDTAPLPDIAGQPASNSQHASHADNVLTALERSYWQLEHDTDAEQRALALCWTLHLIGDIHQPLHTGGLVSARLFPDGDRGGNAIRIGNSNLHAVWDQALRGPRLDDSLPELIGLATSLPDNNVFEPTRWLQESRSILLRQVYPASVIDNVRRSENTGDNPGSIALSNRYRDTMTTTAAIRIAEAGVRISKTLSTITGNP
ncbi:MAG: S1/P1 nuclease [Pseudohongiella sp.]|uniref:S1/P1 nuclease n=1 Tax=Pseudohongiella sp. TaxID=1979412 RepID=UPI0034A09362